MGTEDLGSAHTGVVYFGIAALMALVCELGHRLGVAIRTNRDQETPASLGPMVAGLLTMLAFMLGFTFAMASSQHEQRKQYVVADANAIGTAFLRADLLDEPHASAVRGLLREYVDVRLEAVTVPGALQSGLVRSEELHRALWSEVTAASRATPGVNASMAVQALNQVIDMHTSRVAAGLYNRIPGSVWIALAAISTLTMMTIGLQLRLGGMRRMVAMVPVSLAFAVLVTLVIDLDQPQKGLLNVGQQALVDLRQGMGDDGGR